MRHEPKNVISQKRKNSKTYKRKNLKKLKQWQTKIKISFRLN